MKKVILFLFLIPAICFSQEQAPYDIYGFTMSIDLDIDTTYSYILDNSECTESITRVDAEGGCDYMNSFPYLYFYHKFSLNCCTNHFYEITVKSDSVFISTSENGEYCLCGSCTYTLTFSDPDPQKSEYHIFIEGKNTTVSIASSIIEPSFEDATEIYYKPTECMIYIENDVAKKISITIIDMNGKIISQNTSNQKTINLKVDNINKGTYIVKVDNGMYIKNKKITITK